MQAKKEECFNKGQKALQDWMWKARKTRSNVSKDTDLTYAQVWNWSKGTTVPGLHCAAKIEEYTDGYVTCIMWTQPLKLAKKPNTANTNKSKSQKTKKHTNGRP